MVKTKKGYRTVTVSLPEGLVKKVERIAREQLRSRNGQLLFIMSELIPLYEAQNVKEALE